ncbi:MULTISPECIES: flagellar hook-associated protein FlgK [Rubrivivax]|uniref:Flagellar hook-associated protein 1 n=2 Tax=Sphaerotilaceae TaxID=2975441 RepID=A0ABX0HXZ9_9BURK|nr:MULTISPECIES: flagellar hook-associated protein FlgK [Rubrivivax]MCD0418480.1 flagellar hook-associated protein FlgK [Rubrivivax sp. JA1024]MCC9596230.1 flagellar hook-associated protein FlgK [Rubrivivax sp. JA1055]MCC9647429.1 flagellar hook-associated protein FlgK [Rubrivivax sp. JA1029]NHK99869.1 flagellar hook-associated protein FlgK [Rubrivivax benzoatilyticus]NHL25852.1 flagellar hook-associated protein FlgK [Rubrivivax benzoatilyticus]
MAASSLMSLGMRAMTASYASMQVTGHNISNANVPGYSRQQAELATAKGQYTGAGFFGKGVDVASVTRAHDQFLTRAAASAKSLAAMDETLSQRLQLLEDVFPTGESGLGYSVGNFLNAMVDLASRPGDTATRQVVLARAQDLATRFNAAAGQIDTLQAGVTADLKTTVSAVNGLTKSLAKINDQIAAARGLGQPPNDLLDERDRIVSELSSKIQVSTVMADDGTVGVFVAGGQNLVLGATSVDMRVTTDPLDTSRSALALVDGDKLRMLDENSLGGGSMTALLRFQNEDLVDARNLVGQLAAGVASAVNGQQSLGLDLNGNTGKPLFQVGAPSARSDINNSRDASGNFAATLSISAPDGTVLKASDYLVRPDPATANGYVITRLSNPQETFQRTADASGRFEVEGLEVTVSGTPAASDRFLLQPVARAASGMNALLQDPRQIAAASPLVSSVGSANTGTASVASLTMVRTPDMTASAAISFSTTPSGQLQYSWTVTDGGGTSTTTGPLDWNEEGIVPPEPDSINGARLRLAGVPRAGDTIAVNTIAPAYVGANNGNALALAGLRDQAIVGRSESGGVYSGGMVATDAYAAALADIAVRVQTTKAASTISTSVANQAELARSEVSGVNLDEEAARLIQYQQSYQAAAKVLQVAQSVFETLLQTAAR